MIDKAAIQQAIGLVLDQAMPLAREIKYSIDALVLVGMLALPLLLAIAVLLFLHLRKES